MKSICLSLLVCFSVGLSAQELKITYIANEGVLLEAEDKKVLIDALFDDYYKDYLSPSAQIVNQMMRSENIFDRIDLVLVSHIHRDHFEAVIAGKFIQNHAESNLLSSEQTKKELGSKFLDYQSIESRIRGHKRGVQVLNDKINGLNVTSFFIYHAGGERTRNIENMGFVVNIGGKRVLHLGDADMDAERFKEIDLAKYNIDVALVPYWYMSSDEGRNIIDNHIKAKALIGVHYPKAPSPMAMKEIQEYYPKATVFREALQLVSY